MAYKDILVVLDDTNECEERVNVALRLAERHQAHLIGLLVIEPAPIPTYAMTQLPPEVMELRGRMEDDARANGSGNGSNARPSAGVECLSSGTPPTAIP